MATVHHADLTGTELHPMTTNSTANPTNLLSNGDFGSWTVLSDSLDKSVTSETSASASFTYPGYPWLGIEFTPTQSGYVTKASLQLKIGAGSPTGNITCELQSDNSGYPSNTALDTSSTTLNKATITSSWVYYDFTFTGYRVTAGTKYHLVWKDSAVNGTNYCYIQCASPGGSGSGYGRCDDGTGTQWSAAARNFGNVNFKQYVTVQDPHSWTLSGSGASIAREATKIKIGEYSSKLTRSGTDCYLTQDFYNEKGLTYWQGRQVIYSCWVWCDTAARANLMISDEGGSTESSYHTGGSSWELLKVTHTVEEDDVSGSPATKLLINFDGVDGSTSDYIAETGQTISLEGTAQLDTSQKKFGASSLLLDGDSDYVTVPESADWYFGTGDFTIDLWVRFNSLPSGNNYVLYGHDDGTTDNYMFLYLNDSAGVKTIYWSVKAGGAVVDAFTTNALSISTGVWYHVALVRNGNDWAIYWNGVKDSPTHTASVTMPEIAATVKIGRSDSFTWYFNGWIDNFRITKGVAKWTSTFTPTPGCYCKVSNGNASAYFSGAMCTQGDATFAYSKRPQLIKVYQANGTTDISYATSSKTYEDMSDMSLTVTVEAGASVIIDFDATCSNDSNGLTGFFKLLRDSTLLQESATDRRDYANEAWPTHIQYVDKPTVSQGSSTYTYKIQWSLYNGGSLYTIYNSPATKSHHRNLRIITVGT